ncbi:SGNH/GDSL hydrolase family protein [Blastomonas sp. RAC04]|uniref:SGNH/GDSL hydrolase family protein n=1 Tax=Blastomonas sp. RAC04 TaxID=1842535 RepID=UPI00083DED02|nr:SGNH/GDSL hydrolase family protein [Blastomonas sp. RAC04]
MAFGAVALVALIVIVIAQMLPAQSPDVSNGPNQVKSDGAVVDGALVKASPDPAAASITFDEAIGGILADQRTFGEKGVVLLGDSIVARSGVYEMCAKPILLAGIPGSRVRDWVDLGPDIFAQVEPELVVFALGINDSVAAFNTDPDKWASDYKALAKAALPSRLAFVSIMPIDKSRPGAAALSEEMRERLNAKLKTIAEETGGLLIDPLPTAKGLTLDGVHFNDAGQKQWVTNLSAACQAPNQPKSDRAPIL